MATKYGGSFVMRLSSDLDYELGFIIKEVSKRLNGYNKTSCVEDLVRLAVKDKENIVNEILKLHKDRVVQNDKIQLEKQVDLHNEKD